MLRFLAVRQPSAVRQRTEDYERASLSTWATLAIDTKGRERPEEPDPLRTAFQQDRDRILRSAAFARLADKTHCFVPAGDPHGSLRDRTRLAHTLEVAQVARTLARALRLNEDLVEAIALGHDLGATPFGAAGEEALAVFGDEPFRHQEQSVRVVEVLERGGAGLNLTWEVREGILNHAGTMAPPSTQEGQAVRVADGIATITGDLAAALSAGIVAAGDLPAVVGGVLGAAQGAWLAALADDVVGASLDTPEVALSQRMEWVATELAEFLAQRVHARPAARARSDRAVHCLRSLVVHHLEHPGGLPPALSDGDPPVVRAVDQVAALTDGRALAEFRRLFLPEGGATG
jgi:dGTPase